MTETAVRIPVSVLDPFVTELFLHLGLTEDEAAITTDVLLAADIRGLDSHGLARIPMYVDQIRGGFVNLRPSFHVVVETPATIVFDADNGMGHPAAYRAMRRCLEKAAETGLCLATVRQSNHFGIAGYYATMALEQPGLCGLATSNGGAGVVPTNAREPHLSTAPLALAIPAGKERPFVLDIAMSTVSWGKVEIAQREEKPIPIGWALDCHGELTPDPFAAVALTPLGAFPELCSHKGYGLALFIEVLCGPLAGAAWAREVRRSASHQRAFNIGHAFLAWRIDAFRPLDEFLAHMDEMLHELRTAQPAAGAERVLVPGDLEFEAEVDRRANGIPVHPKVLQSLRVIAGDLGVSPPF